MKGQSKLKALIVRLIRKWAHSDSAVSYLVNFLFRFFSSTVVAGLTTILGTVAIAIMVGKNYYELPFWIVCITYCVFTLCIGWANSYLQHKMKDIKYFQNALRGISQILSAWAITFQTSAKKFSKIENKKDNPAAVKGVLTDMDFQAAAFMVCTELSKFLTGFINSEKIYVTVYQRFKNPDNTEYCRMIAYSQDHEPTGFNKKYPISNNPPAEIGEVEFHSYIFASQKTEPAIFADKESVQKAFMLHEGREERESEICQYIGIPIIPAGLGVTFLLQVDTCVPNFFGENKETTKEFSTNIITPFAQFLHMMYEQGRTVDQILKLK